MKELNERAALNYQLQQDKLTTQANARRACQRMKYRHRRAAIRKHITVVAVDAALAGSMLTAGVAALACLCTGVL